MLRKTVIAGLLALLCASAIAVTGNQDHPPASSDRPCSGTPCPADQDRDGITDRHDQCPDTEPGAPVSQRGCEHDSDGDGVPDWRDRCPTDDTPGPVDALGCRLASEIPLRGLTFQKNSARLGTVDLAALQPAIETLLAYPSLRVEVAGYTDSGGGNAANLKLSQRRADAVMRYFVSRGIPADRLSARGYGEARPIASNKTEAGRARNRRVTLRLLNLESAQE